MVAANVVGTGGTTQVSANSLESVFGLLSTYASFTTVTTLPGPGAQMARDSKPKADGAVAALVPLVHNLVAGSMPGLHGTVFPGHAGDTVTVQVSSHGGWQTVATTKLGPGGGYSVQVPGGGTYRIQYDGINGPSVSVS
jgi:hypothetical protein